MDPASAIFLVLIFLGSNITTHLITQNEADRSCSEVKRECQKLLKFHLPNSDED